MDLYEVLGDHILQSSYIPSHQNFIKAVPVNVSHLIQVMSYKNTMVKSVY